MGKLPTITRSGEMVYDQYPRLVERKLVALCQLWCKRGPERVAVFAKRVLRYEMRHGGLL